jgi:hypothetical protein
LEPGAAAVDAAAAVVELQRTAAVIAAVAGHDRIVRERVDQRSLAVPASIKPLSQAASRQTL